VRVPGYLVGGFPRSTELVKHFREHAKGKLSSEALEKHVVENAREVVARQHEAGFSYIIDGMLNWPDPIRPVFEGLDGVEIDGLARWFDNNFFYKKPIITAHLKRVADPDRRYFHAELIPKERRKIVLPDPYTLARLSENKHYRRVEDLVADLAEQVAETAGILSSDGVGQIQLTAPSLVVSKLERDEAEVAAMGIEIIASRCPRPILLHMPYGPAGNAVPAVLDFPVDIIGFDMTVTKSRELSEYTAGKRVYLGLLDGRNSYMEPVEDILDSYVEMVDELDVSEAHIGPNCDLELLPYSVAVEKVKRLGEILKRMAEL